MRHPPLRRTPAALLALAVLGLSPFAPLVHADPVESNGNSPLNLGTSWVGGSTPTPADVAVFDATLASPAAYNLSLGDDLQSWAGISLSDPAAGVTLLAGNLLTLGSSGITLTGANPAATLTLQNDLLLSGPQDWSIATAASVTGNISSVSALSKSGEGRLLLQGNNTLSSFTLSAGSLALGSSASLGNGSFSINSGTLDSTVPTLAVPVSALALNGSFAYAGTANAVLTLASNSISLPNNASISAAAGTLVLTGPITGPGQIFKTGPAPLAFTGSTSAFAGVTVMQGTIIASGLPSSPATPSTPFGHVITLMHNTTVQIEGNSPVIGGTVSLTGGTVTIVHHGTAASTFGNVFTGSGVINYLPDTTGTFLFDAIGINDGAFSTFSGTLNITAAASTSELRLVGAGDKLMGNVAINLVAANGAPFFLTRDTTGGTQTFGSLSSSSPGTNLQGNSNLGNPVTFQIGALNTSTTFAGNITNGATGPAGLTKQGSGTLTLTSLSNSFSLPVTVQNGQLAMASLTNTSIILGNSTTSSTATFQWIGPTKIYAGTLSIAGPNVVLDASGTGAITFSSTSPIAQSALPTDASLRTLTLSGTNAGFNTLAASLTDLALPAATVPTSLVKSGSGTWVLTASANSYSGGTTIAAGLLVANPAAATAASLGSGNITMTGGLLQFSASTAVVQSIASINPGSHSPSASPGTLQIDSTVNLISKDFNLSTLIINGLHTIAPHSAAGKLNTLTLAHTGTGTAAAYTAGLNLNDNRLAQQTASPADKASKLLALNEALFAGHNGTANTWSSTQGITSSTVAADPKLTIGVFDNAVLHRTNFAGGTNNVDDNSLLLSPALKGDANLDGIVNFNDMLVVTGNWNLSGLVNGISTIDMAHGDLNGDGIVNFNDMLVVTGNWNNSSSIFNLAAMLGDGGAPGDAGSIFTAAVPEPGSAGLLLLAGSLLFRGKRRRA